jgi:hypothetical protein
VSDNNTVFFIIPNYPVLFKCVLHVYELEVKLCIQQEKPRKTRFPAPISTSMFYGLVWFGLWYLTPLSAIFQLICGGQFY